ncbi:hypothetical protein C2E23DRAFT_64435 [Lenzites betulinus]|nr:hypothetical protein C2E23DRAFT_64435 [Lenzites betulinus]
MTPVHADPAAAADPFSPCAFLPLVAALDRTVERFAVSNLVRRYPLIFGPWRERYDSEVAASLKVARAVVDIVARSPHPHFRKQARRLIKTMHRSHDAASSTSRESLAGLLQTTRATIEDVPLPLPSVVTGEPMPPQDDYDVLCDSMERLLKSGPKPLRYKSMTSSALNGDCSKAVDDDFSLSDHRSDSTPAIFRGSGLSTLLVPGLDLDLDLDLDVESRGRVELCFDEDAETMGESQEQPSEDDLFFSDDDKHSIAGDVDLWDADESRDVSMTDDFDDLWASSQSTLDVRPLSSFWVLSVINEAFTGRGF